MILKMMEYMIKKEHDHTLSPSKMKIEVQSKGYNKTYRTVYNGTRNEACEACV